jgi:uncharacterized phiE125 gp8 family phage protein
MALKLITAPTNKPVTTSAMEAHLRSDLSDEITIVNAYIGAITEKAETYTRRALMTQTWELVLDEFPKCGIVIPLPPLQSVTSIKYLDDNGVEQTLSAADYKIDTDTEPARIYPAYGKQWPDTRNEINAVRIRFVCGYLTADAVPESVKAWIMLNVANLYENRETIVVGQKSQVVELTTMADSLLDACRVVSF